MDGGIRLVLLMTVAAIGAPNALAATYLFSADLSGPEESLPNMSPGVGTSRITFDDTAHTLRVQTSFSGLQGMTTVAHIHVRTPPSPVGGVATQVPTFAGFPAGVMSGSYDNSFDLTLPSSFNPSFITDNGGTPATAEAALIAASRAGNAYLNIHSDVFPGGEIRGFLTVIPEPATWATMILGFGMVGSLMRRRSARVSITYA